MVSKDALYQTVSLQFLFTFWVVLLTLPKKPHALYLIWVHGREFYDTHIKNGIPYPEWSPFFISSCHILRSVF